MEELYKVMDDLLEVEFQMKAGMDILKELEEFYMLEKETEKSDARKSSCADERISAVDEVKYSRNHSLY